MKQRLTLDWVPSESKGNSKIGHFKKSYLYGGQTRVGGRGEAVPGKGAVVTHFSREGGVGCFVGCAETLFCLTLSWSLSGLVQVSVL